MKLAVVLIAHSAYTSFLPESVGSVDAQSVPFDEKILVTDNCDAPDFVQGWKTLRVDANNPNPARNAGLALVKSDWVVFFDADNVMHTEYCATARRRIASAHPSVGFIYPTLAYFGKKPRIVAPPVFSEGEVSSRNCFDTCSAWRVEALNDERWDQSSLCHDDWGLVLRLTRHGWRGEQMLTHVNMREHDVAKRRSAACLDNDGNCRADMLWKIRSMGVASLISRPERFDGYVSQLKRLELPPTRSLYVLDNTGDGDFHKHMVETLSGLDGWGSLTIIRDGEPVAEDRSGGDEGRLRHIANLTNKLWSRVREDILFSLDDDCIAKESDAVRRLHYHLRPRNASCVGAAYESKRVPGHLVATFNRDQYGTSIPRNHKEVSEVGAVGAGFTLYVTHHIRESAFPVRPFKKGTFSGHDYNVGHLLNKSGHNVVLDATVRVDHV